MQLSSLRLILAKAWHNFNYSRYKASQKMLINDAVAYLSTLPGDKDKSNFELPLNTLINPDFIKNADWNAIYKDFGFTSPSVEHRKHWEFSQIIYGLDKLGMIAPEKDALGVAAGHEFVLYYLANRCKSVIGTDIYEGSFATGIAQEADPDVISNPDKYAPFPYKKDRLKFMKMNALELEFPDNSFDVVFCLSSIEHFGGDEQYAKSAREMARVLRPGGIAAITTEFSLNNVKYDGFFNYEDLEQKIIKPSGLELVEPFNFNMDEALLKDVRIMPKELGVSPELILQQGKILFTSVSFFLRKN